MFYNENKLIFILILKRKN